VSRRLGLVLLDFDQAPITRRCLLSIAAGDRLPDEIVLVENGREQVDLTGDEALAELKVTVLRPGWNTKAAAGRNLAFNHLVRHTDVQRMVMLDNDTVVPSDFFRLLAERPLQPLEIVAPLVLAMDSGEVQYAGGAFEPNRLPAIITQWPEGADRPREVAWAPTVALALDRDTWLRAGAFDPWYGFSWEDVDWCYRATQRGAVIRVVPDLQVMHEPHQSGGGPFSPERLRQWARNGTVFLFETAEVGWRLRLAWIAGELRSVRRERRAGWKASAWGRLRGLGQGLLEVGRRRLSRSTPARAHTP